MIQWILEIELSKLWRRVFRLLVIRIHLSLNILIPVLSPSLLLTGTPNQSLESQLFWTVCFWMFQMFCLLTIWYNDNDARHVRFSTSRCVLVTDATKYNLCYFPTFFILCSVRNYGLEKHIYLVYQSFGDLQSWLFTLWQLWMANVWVITNSPPPSLFVPLPGYLPVINSNVFIPGSNNEGWPLWSCLGISFYWGTL